MMTSFEKDILVEEFRVLLPEVIRYVLEPFFEPFSGGFIDEMRMEHSHEIELVVLIHRKLSLGIIMLA